LQPTQPGQPAPIPAPPTTPTPPTTPPAQEEQVEPPPPAETATEPQPVPEQIVPGYTPTFVGPDLFNPPAHQGWITLTPSFTLSGEYNDNLFLSSESKTSDAIIGFTPGLTLSMERPGYRLAAGYNTSAEVYVDNSDLSDWGKRHDFFADFAYQIAPRVSFSLSDRFVYGQASNAVTSSGVSVGRRDSWRNTLTPRMRWQATPTTALNVTAGYTLLRFDEGGRDSDTYRLLADVDRRITPRLSGSLGAGVAYIDIKDQSERWTYTPTLGLTYAVTPTLRATVRGGPTIVDRQDEDIEVTPAVSVGLTQTFRFGTLGVGYNRAVTAESVGLSDRQLFFASLLVPTLVRGLQVGFLPRYSIVDRDVSGDDDRTIKALTMTLRATYQIARSISLIGSYTFFYQNEERSSRSDLDIDQNRVFLGVQYAFPIAIY
jgi:hypothetical protein